MEIFLIILYFKTKLKHVILLIITNWHGKWHYLSIKSVSALLRGITSSHNRDFYCLNCFHPYRTQKKLKNMSNYVKIMIFVTQNYQINKINTYQLHQVKIH